MDVGDARAELDQAARALTDAFQLARASGYHPGSRQMRELERAESAYQQARRHHGPGCDLGPAPGPTGPHHHDQRDQPQTEPETERDDVRPARPSTQTRPKWEEPAAGTA